MNRSLDMMLTMISVLVADDQALIRAGLVLLVGGHPDLTVVGEAVDGDEAVELARSLQPDVVLMDLRMPGLDGIAATQRLAADGLDHQQHGHDHVMKVLILTTFDDEDSVLSALQAGASGFLLKDAAPRHLVDALRAVAAGHAWLDPSVARQVIESLGSRIQAGSSTSTLMGRLTAREREVLTLMAHGASNSEIGARLVLSEATVRTHVSRILMKTGARDRTQAVVLAYQAGLVRVGPSTGTAPERGLRGQDDLP